jgi:hypothetical protein
MEQNLIGKHFEFTTPSGDVITIREQNGNDDDILSNIKQAKKGLSFNDFIKAIVVKSERAGGRLSDDDLLAMPIRDKNVILINSRIFSLGSEVEFKWNWGTDVKPKFRPYIEELNDYIWDYSLPFPKEGETGYDSERIPPYPTTEPYLEATLASGKVIRFDYLNGLGEKYILEKREKDELSINTNLLARNLSLRNLNGKFDKIENFSNFSPMDMREIRSLVVTFDKEYECMSEVINPDNKEESQYISLLQLPDFFFPLLEI